MKNQFSPVNCHLDLEHLLIKNKKGQDSLASIPIKVFERREYIYNLGEYSNKIYIIKKGRIKIKNNLDDAKSIIKNVFTDGELFGEFSLVGEELRIDFAMAMERTELYVFNSIELYQQMQNNPNLTAHIIYLLGTRSIATEQKIESLMFKKARTRIVDFLNDFVKKRGQRMGYEMLVPEFFTHQEIANITSTSRQTVTTVLNELRNKNVLTFNRKRLLIRDLDLLRAESSL